MVVFGYARTSVYFELSTLSCVCRGGGGVVVAAQGTPGLANVPFIYAKTYVL